MQLTPISKIQKQNFIFHKPKDFKIKSSNLTFKRLKIETQYPNNKVHLLLNHHFFSVLVFQKEKILNLMN